MLSESVDLADVETVAGVACPSPFGLVHPEASFWMGDISRDGGDKKDPVRDISISAPWHEGC